MYQTMQSIDNFSNWLNDKTTEFYVENQFFCDVTKCVSDLFLVAFLPELLGVSNMPDLPDDYAQILEGVNKAEETADENTLDEDDIDGEDIFADNAWAWGEHAPTRISSW